MDTASGTEAAPGHKDPQKLRAFFDARLCARARSDLAAQRSTSRGRRGSSASPRRPPRRSCALGDSRERAAPAPSGKTAASPERPSSTAFGPYGGQFVPETLMPALAELEQAWGAGARRSGVPRRAGGTAARLWRAPDPAVSCREAVRAGRAAAVSEARGPQPHRLAQAEQRPRSGAAGEEDGQAAESSPRRVRASMAWRRRPCARCWGSSVSSTWAWRTCAGSGRTCSGWSCWVRPSASGRRRGENAQGGDLGRDPRLGDERARAPTT